MKLISEPTIPVKIQKMKQRVRWQDPCIVQHGIDQTSLILDDGKSTTPDFSFIVVGDTGTKPHYGDHPQRQVAKMMLNHLDDCRFVLHTGDVVYMVGSSEYYPSNFIEPYREFLLGGENPQSINYDKMVFKLPILPVLGNHDYYDVPLLYRFITGPTLHLRKMFSYKDIEIGWHGSNQGDAFARAFLDYLGSMSPVQLENHLRSHYTDYTSKNNNQNDRSLCLHYQPGKFTRLPNRYYTFNYGGIDFFALDSNTFNTPLPLVSNADRMELQKRCHQIDQEELQLLKQCDQLNPDKLEDLQQLSDLSAKLDQLNEVKLDLEKQLALHTNEDTDFEQLTWFKEKLIASWRNKEVRGRILFLHHPPYVTEGSKWKQGQTLAVRHRLREVLDDVQKSLGKINQNRPLVDIVFSGHAHCLEYLKTVDTGHADSFINYIISGGGGRRPRRQRVEGKELMEEFRDMTDVSINTSSRKVADSLLYVGRTGEGSSRKKPYSCVKIDVKSGFPAKFIITPLVTELIEGKWCEKELESFTI
ncbi:metallophosphoesterase [Anabaena sp. FACHB-1237]|uniref:metallophosphoesterase family protein n=1 Tax=Anabaena sp. FACHB-1237 TaxID=2692769 RepID=UPI001680EAEC|nr:metallophosphoesterase [Anabaena sp. FACHB-1237]MBD2136639.1 metallophosphoesterase [Anabaena sp. FACHB-1237]